MSPGRSLHTHASHPNWSVFNPYLHYFGHPIVTHGAAQTKTDIYQKLQQEKALHCKSIIKRYCVADNGSKNNLVRQRKHMKIGHVLGK